MSEWVKDLEDQNEMLVNTVHELEEAAASRVQELETQLQENSNQVTGSASALQKPENVSTMVLYFYIDRYPSFRMY